MDGVINIANYIKEQVSSLEEKADWKEYVKIFGKAFLVKLGPRFFRKFDENDIRRMGDKFKSLFIFIDYAGKIGVNKLYAVLLWFAIQALFYFIQKVS